MYVFALYRVPSVTISFVPGAAKLLQDVPQPGQEARRLARLRGLPLQGPPFLRGALRSGGSCLQRRVGCSPNAVWHYVIL